MWQIYILLQWRHSIKGLTALHKHKIQKLSRYRHINASEDLRLTTSHETNGKGFEEDVQHCLQNFVYPSHCCSYQFKINWFIIYILTLKEISENDKDHRFIMDFVDIEFVLAELGGLYYGKLWQCWYPSRAAGETAERQPGRWGDKHPCETPVTSQSLCFPIQTSPEALTDTDPVV